MKLENKTFWIYLEPHVFIFNERSKSMIYNSLNGCHFIYKKNSVLNLLKEISLPKNGYCIYLPSTLSQDNNIIDFIYDIEQSDSGGRIPNGQIEENRKPFIFSPKLRLYNDVNRIRQEEGLSLGNSILRNLCEVSIYFPGDCPQDCFFCKDYSKQFIHCTTGLDSSLRHKDYSILLKNIEASGVNIVNLIINGGTPITLLRGIVKILNECTFKKVIHINIRNINKYIKIILGVKNAKICVSINSFADSEKNSFLHKEIESHLIHRRYIVRSNTDMSQIRTDNKYNTTIVPFFDGKNIEFFKKNVYISEDDIFRNPINRKQIFRRQVLNENFFGKIHIMPSGDVFSNLNMSSIGNIKKDTLGKMVYHEFEKPSSWLLTRDCCDCKDCFNKYLCPSPNNYELVIDRFNLCHING